MPPITIRIPTQAELLAMQQNPNSLLAQYNAANAPKPAVGSTNAVTAAGANPLGGPSNLNNLSNPDWIKAMSEMITQINVDAQQKANAARIPNATGLEQKSSEDIGAALRGELPADVVTQLGQRAAERGVYSGSPMGANTTADLMRSLGLTSLDLTNRGQEWLTAALGRNPGATPANTQALVTTPAQAEALALQRQNMELDYLARMAAIQAANRRTASGYGGGVGGGSRFAPATNWQGGAPTSTVTPTPINQPWHLPYSLDQGGGLDTVLPGMDLYNPANDVVQPGSNYNPDFNPLAGGGWGAYDVNPVSYNPDLYPDIFNGGSNDLISDEEWDQMLYGLYDEGG